MRPRKPWYRKQNDTWYIEVHGQQTKLAVGKNNKREAELKFHKLEAELPKQSRLGNSLTVDALAELFFDWSKNNHAAETVLWYKTHIDSFRRFEKTGSLQAQKVIKNTVTKWLDAHPSWKAKRGPIECVKRLFSWAEDEGLIDSNPLIKLKKPAARSRVVLVTPEEREEILGEIKDEAFRCFVFAMQQTGCRPSEIARITANEVYLERGLWIFEKHKTAKKTKKVRVVYLTPEMVELSRKLVERRPSGPLFTTRNRVRVDGVLKERGFTRNGVRCRFRELRRRLPHLKHLIAYAYRHSFATEALVKGIGPAQVAELLGHQSLDMIMKHYSHLSEKVDHMREVASQAVG